MHIENIEKENIETIKNWLANIFADQVATEIREYEIHGIDSRKVRSIATYIRNKQRGEHRRNKTSS
jgi:hypothetical protein